MADNILDTFASEDFGWSFASDEEFTSKTSQLEKDLQTTKEASEDIKKLQTQINRVVEHQKILDDALESNAKRVEKKIDQLLNLTMEKIQSVITEHGSSMAELSELICQSNNDGLEEKYNAAMKDKMRRIEQLILPFLKGLTKDKDKEYIRWPNRQDFLENKAKELIAITRS